MLPTPATSRWSMSAFLMAWRVRPAAVRMAGAVKARASGAGPMAPHPGVRGIPSAPDAGGAALDPPDEDPRPELAVQSDRRGPHHDGAAGPGGPRDGVGGLDSLGRHLRILGVRWPSARQHGFARRWGIRTDDPGQL